MQEATVVIRNIFRKYPNRYESIISTLCENLDSLDEPEAKAAMIWVIGQYADRIDNSDVLLDDFLFSFADEPIEVQLALLTATVKLFIQRPTKGQELVPKVLKWATEETDNPDLRDRGYMYWRLLSSDPATAKQIVMGEKPAITAESEKLDPNTLEEMCLSIGNLATIYLKPVHQVFRNARTKKLIDSPALQKHTLPSYIYEQETKKLPSVMGNGLPGLNGNNMDFETRKPINGSSPTNSRVNTSAAADDADHYSGALGGQQSTSMQMREDGSDGSPAIGGLGNRQYVVNQNHPEQVYQPQMGDGDGDLLSF